MEFVKIDTQQRQKEKKRTWFLSCFFSNPIWCRFAFVPNEIVLVYHLLLLFVVVIWFSAFHFPLPFLGAPPLWRNYISVNTKKAVCMRMTSKPLKSFHCVRLFSKVKAIKGIKMYNLMLIELQASAPFCFWCSFQQCWVYHWPSFTHLRKTVCATHTFTAMPRRGRKENRKKQVKIK